MPKKNAMLKTYSEYETQEKHPRFTRSHPPSIGAVLCTTSFKDWKYLKSLVSLQYTKRCCAWFCNNWNSVTGSLSFAIACTASKRRIMSAERWHEIRTRRRCARDKTTLKRTANHQHPIFVHCLASNLSFSIHCCFLPSSGGYACPDYANTNLSSGSCFHTQDLANLPWFGGWFRVCDFGQQICANYESNPRHSGKVALWT